MRSVESVLRPMHRPSCVWSALVDHLGLGLWQDNVLSHGLDHSPIRIWLPGACRGLPANPPNPSDTWERQFVVIASSLHIYSLPALLVIVNLLEPPFCAAVRHSRHGGPRPGAKIMKRVSVRLDFQCLRGYSAWLREFGACIV